MDKISVSICVATYRRPEGLRRLLTGLGELAFRKGNVPDLEVVVVDNDPSGSARGCCERVRPTLPWPLTYHIEPRPGVSHARNAAITCVRDGTSFVAFIDDDEVPNPWWLNELLHTQQAYNADVVTGPVLPRFEGPVPAWIERGSFFERPRHRTGHSMKFAATNNVLIRTEVFDRMEEPFDIRFSLTGGEDTHFFMRVVSAGHRIVWADDAIVHEWVPEKRTNAAYILKRSYFNGRVFGRCVTELEPGVGRRITRIAKCGVRVLQGLLLALGAPFSGRRVLVAGLAHIFRSAGMLSTLVRTKADGRKFTGTGPTLYS